MQDNTVMETETSFLLIILIIAVLLLCIMAFYINVVIPFYKERNYIRMEMLRSCDHREYQYWKRELKRLYIAHIPILGNLILKYMR